MRNLFDRYFSEISQEIWKQLFETVSLQQKTILQIIEQETGLKKKQKAQETFLHFTERMKMFLDKSEKIAA